MFFKDIIGQQAIKEQLIRSVKDGYIPHARLIAGQEGFGALPLALAYARYVHCTNRKEEDACGECPSCRQFDKYAHPDLHFVFPILNKKNNKEMYCDDFLSEWRKFLQNSPYAGLNAWLEQIEAGNNHAIYTRESNEIARKLNLKAYESDYKIMIIWTPEEMDESGANKLLKLLEEPPAKTIFLLISAEPERLLTTIRSRTQLLTVPQISNEDMTQAIRRSYDLSDNDVNLIVRLAKGSYTEALTILEASGDNEIFLELFQAMMRNSWTKDVAAMRTRTDQFAAMNRDKQKAFLAYSQRMIRDNFLYCLHEPNINYMSQKETDFAVNFAPYVHTENVVGFMNELALAEQHIDANVNAKMIFFDLSMKVAVLLKTNPQPPSSH